MEENLSAPNLAIIFDGPQSFERSKPFLVELARLKEKTLSGRDWTFGVKIHTDDSGNYAKYLSKEGTALVVFVGQYSMCQILTNEFLKTAGNVQPYILPLNDEEKNIFGIFSCGPVFGKADFKGAAENLDLVLRHAPQCAKDEFKIVYGKTEKDRDAAAKVFRQLIEVSMHPTFIEGLENGLEIRMARSDHKDDTLFALETEKDTCDRKGAVIPFQRKADGALILADCLIRLSSKRNELLKANENEFARVVAKPVVNKGSVRRWAKQSDKMIAEASQAEK